MNADKNPWTSFSLSKLPFQYKFLLLYKPHLWQTSSIPSSSSLLTIFFVLLPPFPHFKVQIKSYSPSLDINDIFSLNSFETHPHLELNPNKWLTLVTDLHYWLLRPMYLVFPSYLENSTRAVCTFCTSWNSLYSVLCFSIYSV